MCFNKSKLSTVVGNIQGAGILNKRSKLSKLKKLLVKESGRKKNDPLFKSNPEYRTKKSDVTVNAWITEVLQGNDDKIFDEMKNPDTAQILPDAQDEVVIELRALGFDLKHENFSLEDLDSGLLDYMKKVYAANKSLKYGATLDD